MPITPEDVKRIEETVKILLEQIEALRATAELDVRTGPALALPAPRLSRIP